MLKDSYALTVACFAAEPTSEYKLILLEAPKLTLIRKILVSFFLLIRWFSQAHGWLHPYGDVARQMDTENFDMVIANDVESLPLAFKIARQHTSKVLFDAHEYAPRHFEDKFIWRMFFQPLNVYLCNKYLPRVAQMLTIGEGLAKEYEKEFGLKPVIITNANKYFDLRPSPVKDKFIRLVHHGIATPSRNLEVMIDMMNYLDERFTLDMYLVSEGFSAKKTIDYPEKLRALAAKTKRVRILPPIKSEDIVTTINQYDVGVFLIPPVNFNYANTLPNKLFDFIQARLAIAIGPTPEMANIVRKYNLGVVSDDFSARNLALQLNKLSLDKLESFKHNTSQAAQQLNAEENQKILLSLVTNLLK